MHVGLIILFFWFEYLHTKKYGNHDHCVFLQHVLDLQTLWVTVTTINTTAYSEKGKTVTDR